jgi:hypothetical protein
MEANAVYDNAAGLQSSDDYQYLSNFTGSNISTPVTVTATAVSAGNEATASDVLSSTSVVFGFTVGRDGTRSGSGSYSDGVVVETNVFFQATDSTTSFAFFGSYGYSSAEAYLRVSLYDANNGQTIFGNNQDVTNEFVAGVPGTLHLGGAGGEFNSVTGSRIQT